MLHANDTHKILVDIYILIKIFKKFKSTKIAFPLEPKLFYDDRICNLRGLPTMSAPIASKMK